MREKARDKGRLEDIIEYSHNVMKRRKREKNKEEGVINRERESHFSLTH